MRRKNSHNHLFFAVWVLWLHFQLLHITVADLRALPGALAFGSYGRGHRGCFVVPGSPALRPPLEPTQTSLDPRMANSRCLGFPGWDQTAQRNLPALTLQARGAQCQEQQEQRGRQEPHADQRGAAQERGHRDCAVWRPGTPPGSDPSAQSTSPASAGCRGAVGGCRALSVAARWLCALLCDHSTSSLRQPWPLLNQLLPSQRASSLICRTTR